MLIKKSLAGAALLISISLGACNLSNQLSAPKEVSLNPPTHEVRPTRTPIPLTNPTRTPFAAPTITVLGGSASASHPASQSGAGAAPPTQPPPEGACSLKATGNFDVNVRTGPGTEFKIMSALPAGQYMLVINQSQNGWFQIPWGREAVGWVSSKVVTLFGPCDALIAQWAADRARPATLTPTPTAMFGANIGIPQNNIVTKVTIGSIPAGTTVMISTAMFTGSGYIYDIMTVDGRFEKATDAQLAFSSSGGLLPFPTPTPYVYVTTPTAVFGNEIGIGQKRIVTAAQVGDLPAGTTVQIGSAYFDGKTWHYNIFAEDGRHATASEFQLSYNIVEASRPGATPTAMFGFTMNIAFNRLITREKVGDIPEGTTVVVTSTQFNGDFYLYGIMTVDGRSAMATDSQLAYSVSGGAFPFPTPTPYMNLPTPSAFFQSEIGMQQYRVVTMAQVGSIPAGTIVRIGSAQYDGTTWLYNINSHDGKSEMAKEAQLAYAPNAGGGGPTPTVTIVATATVPVMDLPTDVSPSDVIIPDGVCTVTAKSKTTLYASPKTSAAVVGVLNPGPWAQVGATNSEGWYKVTIWTDGRQGWGNINSMTLHGPCDALAVEGTG